MRRRSEASKPQPFARLAVLAIVLAGLAVPARAGDWPMWRCDSARSGRTSQSLPDDMHLLWTRQLPELKPTYREPRIQFDGGYEPIVLGKRMFVAVSNEDRVVAYDTETGESKWEYFAEGPIRLAPVAYRNRVVFGSDDGYLHCVDAATGELSWKFQAVPSNRKVLGNGRLISLWPLRGGPVVHDGKIYFAAGVWPFEGVFIYSLDAETGEVVWRNDESGYLYGQHPHSAEALGGVTPQGYLVVNGDELIVPCGQAVPARYDLASGELLAFELPKPGRLPGGWFASADVRRGEMVLDAATNSDLHEDKVYQGPGEAGVRLAMHAGIERSPMQTDSRESTARFIPCWRRTRNCLLFRLTESSTHSDRRSRLHAANTARKIRRRLPRRRQVAATCWFWDWTMVHDRSSVSSPRKADSTIT